VVGAAAFVAAPGLVAVGWCVRHAWLLLLLLLLLLLSLKLTPPDCVHKPIVPDVVSGGVGDDARAILADLNSRGGACCRWPRGQ
jgi:hypothetical protein